MNNDITLLENNDFKVEHYESCIVCEEDTKVPKDLHIDYRDYYIEGAGQLCKSCYTNINNKKYIPLQ